MPGTGRHAAAQVDARAVVLAPPASRLPDRLGAARGRCQAGRQFDAGDRVGGLDERRTRNAVARDQRIAVFDTPCVREPGHHERRQVDDGSLTPDLGHCGAQGVDIRRECDDRDVGVSVRVVERLDAGRSDRVRRWHRGWVGAAVGGTQSTSRPSRRSPASDHELGVRSWRTMDCANRTRTSTRPAPPSSTTPVGTPARASHAPFDLPRFGLSALRPGFGLRDVDARIDSIVAPTAASWTLLECPRRAGPHRWAKSGRSCRSPGQRR